MRDPGRERCMEGAAEDGDGESLRRDNRQAAMPRLHADPLLSRARQGRTRRSRTILALACTGAFVAGFVSLRPKRAVADPHCWVLNGGKWCGKSGGLYRIPVNDHTPARWPVSDALSTWNYASPTNYMHLYKVNSGQYVDYWSGRYGKTGWLGITYYSNDPDGCWSAGMSVKLNDTYQDDNYGWINAITRHETGHVLGLSHSSSCEYSLMWPVIPNCGNMSSLGTCDSSPVASLYPR